MGELQQNLNARGVFNLIKYKSISENLVKLIGYNFFPENIIWLDYYYLIQGSSFF